VPHSTVNKSDGRLLPWTLTIIGGAIITFVIANYESLIPYHWERFTTPDGAFSAQFPGRPVAEDQERAIASGKIVTVHIVGTQTPDHTYYGFTRIDDRDSEGKSADDRLNSARDGAIQNVQGHLIAEKRITVQKFPARDIQARVRGGMLLDARLVAVEGQLLMLLVTSPSEHSRDGRNIQKFYDSFKVQRPVASNGNP
jgi:hypothetical protein